MSSYSDYSVEIIKMPVLKNTKSGKNANTEAIRCIWVQTNGESLISLQRPEFKYVQG